MKVPSLVHVVIPAAGMGSRLARDGVVEPKPLLQLNSKHTILGHILAAASRMPADIDVAIPIGSRSRFVDSEGMNRVGWHETAPIGFLPTVRLLLELVPREKTVVVVLGDDVTLGVDLVDLVTPVVNGAWASQAIVREDDLAAMGRACQVTIEGSRMIGIVEKPESPSPGWRGCGLFGLSSMAADEIRDGRNAYHPGLSEAYGQWVLDGREIKVVKTSFNVNVNTRADLYRARRKFVTQTSLID